ncbi:hypothetical protein [Cereal chlorotic mottle virus]|uniref:Uncharacterized protein n=1 Tax=Cereal chlorotic mottle virus TaxID=2964312 RepID=A0A976X7E1_9RHAB|nr:hypothetical protein [Cereal chlorotic mottle virus]
MDIIGRTNRESEDLKFRFLYDVSSSTESPLEIIHSENSQTIKFIDRGRSFLFVESGLGYNTPYPIVLRYDTRRICLSEHRPVCIQMTLSFL